MASLTHVCVWDNNRWKRISAEDACKMYPDTKISAKTGLFMCELCGQYVLLTGAGVVTRHFRHSSYEESKDCPERKQLYLESSDVSFNPRKQFVPMRLFILNKRQIELFVGIKPLKTRIHGEKYYISINGLNGNIYRCSSEQLEEDSFTYIPMGKKASSMVSVEFETMNHSKIRELDNYYITRIAEVYDKEDGHSIPYDGDVIVGKSYYVLTHRIFSKKIDSIEYKQCVDTYIGKIRYKVYEVKALAYTEMSARFFLAFHCRLTDRPVNIFPIWPPCNEEPYVISYSDSDIFFYMEGDAKAKLSSGKNIHIYPGKDYRCIKIPYSKENNEVLAYGRIKMLGYYYLKNECPEYKYAGPCVNVKDVNGKNIKNGINTLLPKQKILIIDMLYDGKVSLYDGNIKIDCINISSKKKLVLDNIKYGMRVVILVGFDILFECSFVNCKRVSIGDDGKELIKKLNNYKGNNVVFPKRYAAKFMGNKEYPEIDKWLKKRAHEGYVDKKALLLLNEVLMRDRDEI